MSALLVPKYTVASIILKWRKFGTTKTLPRAGRPAKLSNRALVRENLPERQPSLQHSTYHAFMVVARRKPILSKRHMTARLEFTKRHLKDSDHEKQDSLV
ncbi:unnamed protein product [Oncorhynchus mykiss]|uniref:Transposase Tc1-like domain-containing protein n=1 Tax=Oncorhynchus mykiss TaxID=8022 RepID=A0A060WN57_ONCMY|nr:unnamed protein product [Oncorhynchus mykiss]